MSGVFGQATNLKIWDTQFKETSLGHVWIFDMTSVPTLEKIWWAWRSIRRHLEKLCNSTFCQSSVKPYLIYRLDGSFWCSRFGWKYNLVDNGSLDISSLFLTRARLPFIVTVLFYANRSLSPMSPLPSPSASVWWARGILEHARFITSTALNRLPPSLFFGCL